MLEGHEKMPPRQTRRRFDKQFMNTAACGAEMGRSRMQAGILTDRTCQLLLFLRSFDLRVMYFRSARSR